MYVLIYLPEQDRHIELVEALAQGLKKFGSTVVIAPLDEFKGVNEWAQMVCLIGHGNRDISRAYNRSGRHVLLVEPAYLDPGRYYRMALDGWHSPWMKHTEYNTDRLFSILKRAGIELQPPRESSPKALTYVGISLQFANWHGLANPTDFDRNQIRTVTAHLTGRVRKIYYITPMVRVSSVLQSHRIPVEVNTMPVEYCLKESNSVVSWGQPALVQAAIMGVPVVDTSHIDVSPLNPFVETNPIRAFSPRALDEASRLRALARLAHHQFTLDEIRSGFAMEQLTKRTITRLEGLDPNSAEYVIKQYEIMHEQDKRYRGKLSDAFIKTIGELVIRFKAESLLDYGSGKGRQYSQLRQHEKWQITPVCYDPGYPPLAKEPEGTFDGVICTDVAEHVPPAGIADFLKKVIGYSNRFVFFCIFTDLAVKTLPDGRNAHLTVKPPKWWNEEIVKAIVAVRPPHSSTTINKPDPSEETYIIGGGAHQIVVFYRSSNDKKEAK